MSAPTDTSLSVPTVASATDVDALVPMVDGVHVGVEDESSPAHGNAGQGCPGHPSGAHDQLTVGEVIEMLPTTLGWDELNPGDPPRRRLRGARRVLGWLAEQAGQGWQQRWVASGADHDRGWIAKLSAADPRGDKINERELRAGLNWLLLARLVRPGYGYFHPHKAQLLLSAVPQVISPALFARLGCSPTDPAPAREPVGGGEAGHQQRELTRMILAKIVLHTGKDLERLQPDDLLEYRDAVNRMTRPTSWGLPGVWDHLVGVGVLPEGSSLRAAVRPGQRSAAELIAAANIRSDTVRRVLVAYFDERRASLDYNSLRHMVSVIAKTFWADIEAHHPGIDSLHLPEDVAAGWKQRLQHIDLGGGRTRKRESYFSILIWVNGFYVDIAEWARTDPFWVPYAVPSPVRRKDTAGVAKHRNQTIARMHQRTRERLPALPALLEAADVHRREQTELLAAATAVSGGDTFTVAGTLYRRVAGAKDHRGARYHGVLVRVDNLAAGTRQNLTYSETDAFWAWAIIETLRNTGLRIEELLELTHLALISHRLPKTGEIVPLLQIVPSKADQERLLLVSPELASVLATIITRLRGEGGGSIRLVSRFDPHERLTGPPLPHLFQTTVKSSSPGVLAYQTVRRLLNDTAERAGLRDASGERLNYKAHDFRRIFATEAITSGLPVHIAARLLGHRTLTTTQSYHAVFDDELILAYRGFLDARRSLRPQAEYREPTDLEWREFEQHFEQRKLELGNCGRPYGTPCAHEHACIRCPMLRVDPGQHARLAAIAHNLTERITEARTNGWHGEVAGLHISLTAAKDKLAALERTRRHQADLGMPRLSTAGPTHQGGPTCNNHEGPTR